MRTALLSDPFRPFFLAAAAYAVLGIASWVAWYTGFAPDWLPPLTPMRHGHDMITGFAGAIIAGFLLTAAGNWTGTPTTTPLTLCVIFVLWLLGRLAPLAPVAGPTLTAISDVTFWLMLVALLLRVVLKTRNWRNLGFAVLPLVFGVFDLGWHGLNNGWLTGNPRTLLVLGIDLLTLIMVAMGGRIIPFFTGRRIQAANVRQFGWLNLSSNTMAAATALAGLLDEGMTQVILSGITGVLVIIRWSYWNPTVSLREPMLWILHLGYLWLGLGLLLRCALPLGDWIPASAAYHAIAVGALGTLGLGMLARVALGHTGRRIEADPTLVTAFVCVSLVAPLRLLATLGGPFAGAAIAASAGFWCLAWLLYLGRFVPILIRPRIS